MAAQQKLGLRAERFNRGDTDNIAHITALGQDLGAHLTLGD